MKQKSHFNVTGPIVRHLRKQRGWSQQKLAERLQDAGWKISRSSLAKVECQIVRVGDFDLQNFANVFGISIGKLFPRESIKAPVQVMIGRANGHLSFQHVKPDRVAVLQEGKVKR